MLLDRLKLYAESEQPAVCCGEDVMSYRTLCARANALARRMREEYATAKPVVIFGDKENDMVVCMFAAVLAGKTFVALPSMYPAEQLSAILQDAEADLVLSPSALPFDAHGLPVLDRAEIDALTERYRGCELLSCSYAPDDTAMLSYTSGSTGHPKGVAISYRNLEAKVSLSEGDAENFVSLLTEPHREACLVSYGFTLSLVFFYHVGHAGGTWYSIPTETVRDAKRLFELLLRIQPNSFALSPSLAKKLMEFPDYNGTTLSEMRGICLGGEPLTAEVARAMWERFPGIRLFNGFGATESTASGPSCDITAEVLESCGTFLPVDDGRNPVVFLIDEEGRRITEDGQPGEIVIFGDMVAQGYHKDPEQTAQHFYTLEDGTRAFHAGDMGVLRDGRMYVTGRRDRQVKIGGNRVELEEVESVLARCSGVQQCAVAAQDDAAGGKRLVGFVSLTAECAGEAQLGLFLRIKREMMELVPSYKIPQKLIFLEELPKNDHGKVDRAALRTMLEN